MPLDESRLSFQIPRTDRPRGKIIKLGQMITDRAPARLRGVTGDDPEYWGLAGRVTDEMADVALKMLGEVSGAIPHELTSCWNWEVKKTERMREADIDSDELVESALGNL